MSALATIPLVSGYGLESVRPEDWSNAGVSFPLSNGHFTLVDAEDVDRLRPYRWYGGVFPGGKVYAQYTYRRDGVKITISMHRFIMGAGAGEMVDHKNGYSLDNRRENLRFCTSSQNNQNRRVTSRASGLPKGVYRATNSRRFAAQIYCDGKRYCLGAFDTPEEAAAAYDAKAIELHKEFASLNRLHGQSGEPD